MHVRPRPLVSVLIVNFNTMGLLKKCLNSVFGSVGHFDLEVFLADNHSGDQSVELVRSQFPEVSLVAYSENKGFTCAVNDLLQRARGDYCLILHPDVQLDSRAIEAFLSFYRNHEKVGILGGNLYYPDGQANPCEVAFPGLKSELVGLGLRMMARLPVLKAIACKHNPLQWSHKRTEAVNWVWNACMMVRKEVFEQIGFLDEDFFVWFADWDFCKRATDVGWSIYYVYSAKAIHYERQSFTEAGVPIEEVRYKIDGWHSAPPMIRDRYVFFRKHCPRISLSGVKTLDLTQNVLRLGLMAGAVLFRTTSVERASYPMRACLNSIQAVLRF